MSVAGLGAAFARAYARPLAASTTAAAPVAVTARPWRISASVARGLPRTFDDDDVVHTMDITLDPDVTAKNRSLLAGFEDNLEVKEPVPEDAPQRAEPSASPTPATPAPSAAAALPSTSSKEDTKQVNALANYIPGDVLTLYLGASAALTTWAATHASESQGLQLPSPYNTYSLGLFLFCLVLAPVWAYLSVQNACPPNVKLPRQAWGWPVIAAPIAFAAYSLAIPSTWVSHFSDASLFATFAVLGVTPLLSMGGKTWLRLYPPK